MVDETRAHTTTYSFVFVLWMISPFAVCPFAVGMTCFVSHMLTPLPPSPERGTHRWSGRHAYPGRVHRARGPKLSAQSSAGVANGVGKDEVWRCCDSKWAVDVGFLFQVRVWVQLIWWVFGVHSIFSVSGILHGSFSLCHFHYCGNPLRMRCGEMVSECTHAHSHPRDLLEA